MSDSLTDAIRELVEASLDKAADLDDLDATLEIAQTVRSWLASVDALDNLPKSDDILACQRWRNNAEMVAAVLALLDRTGQIPAGPWVDLTYGEHGGWWKPGFNPPPAHLVRCIGPDTTGYDSVPMWTPDDWSDMRDGTFTAGWYRTDFRNAPFPDDSFAVTCFDPPYVLKGTDAQFAGMNAAYGIDSATMRARGAGHRATDYAHVKERDITGYLTRHGWEQRTQSRWATGWFKGDHSVTVPRQSHAGDYPSHVAACFAQIASATGVGADDLAAAIRPPTRKQALEQLIIDGLTEAVRITRPGGWIAAKAGRGIDGGRLFSTDDLMVRTGWALGLTEVASTWLLTTPRSQEHNGPQRSPRANTSRLTIFEVPT